MDDQVELPLIFTKPNSLAIWGAVSLLLALVFAILIVNGAAIHSRKDLFSGITLIVLETFCGFKLLLERFAFKIIATQDQLISKSLLGNVTAITWVEINSVTLEQKPASLKIKSDQQMIPVSLKIKNWETLLEILEDKVSDEKFFGF